MDKFNVLIQAYQHPNIHGEMLCCIIMKFLPECKHTDVTWPKSAAPIRPEFELGIYEFMWPIYKVELGNSDFRAFWNAALGLIDTTRVHAVHERWWWCYSWVALWAVIQSNNCWFGEDRVTTHLENLEKSGNSKVSRESQGKWKKSG